MSKKWTATHTAADGTPLMFEEGKLYSQWAWDNFGDAYRGEAKELPRFNLPERVQPGQAWHTGIDWSLATVDWGTKDEDTADMAPPFEFDLSDGGKP